MSTPAAGSIDRRKAFTSTVWSAIENGGLSIVSFLSLIVYSRLLAPAEFGLFAMTLAMVELFGLIATMPFHDALVQRAEVEEIHFDSAFSASLLIGAVLCLACWLAGPLFSHLAGDARAGTVLAVLSLGFLMSGATATIVARDRRELSFRRLAMRSLVGRLGGAAIGIGAAFAGLGVWSLVIQQLMMQALGSLVLWIMAAHRPRLRLQPGILYELSIFGAPALGALFVNFAIKRLLIFAAGIFLGTGTAGYINIAFRTIDTFWSLMATAINQVALPIMSRLQNDAVRLHRAYRLAVSLACTLLYPAFVGIAVTAPEVVELLFGRRWLPSAPYVTMLGLLVLLQGPRLFIGPLLTAVGRPGYVLRSYAIGFAYLVGAIAITRLPSPQAVILVWSGCELLYVAAFGFHLWRGTGITLADQFRAIRTPLIAVGAMAAAVVLLRMTGVAALPLALRLAVFCGGGAITYGLALYLTDRRLIFELRSFVLAKEKPQI